MGLERCLLYCIFRAEKPVRPVGLSGVDGQSVSLLSHNELCAAVSNIARPQLTSDVPQITAYKNIIDAFHQDPAVHGIIPMRYGLVFNEEADILRLLERRSEQYAALLKELDGCVEMGIRILLSDRELPIVNLRENDEGIESRIPIPKTSGRDYLHARRAYYKQEEQLVKEMEAIIEQCRNTFSGLFVEYKTEIPSILNSQASTFSVQSMFCSRHSPFPISTLSLYFLVPRRDLESFRQTFRHMACKTSLKYLLSGPWPPYNFV